MPCLHISLCAIDPVEKLHLKWHMGIYSAINLGAKWTYSLPH